MFVLSNVFSRRWTWRTNKQTKRDVSTNTKPRVAVTAKIPERALEKIKEKCQITHHWDVEDALPRPELLKMVKDIDGLFCILSDKINEEVLESAKNLKVVSTMSVGYDHIDLPLCTKKGIKVGHTPGVLTESVADHVVAILLTTARRLPEGYTAVKEGKWPKAWIPLWMCGKDVHGSTVGIIGMGRIGEAVAKRLSGFGCKILYTGPNRKSTSSGATYVDLETLLKESDFVIPLCPLKKETEKMINASVFKQMKKDAILINVSRGAIVDQDDLLKALKNHEIGGCGLDVTTPEPLPVDHPLLDPSLEDRVVIIPHIASATVQTRTAMAMIAAENLICGLNNKPLPHPLNQIK